MITNTGKSIIGKYMLGQAPAYASFLAVGCGPTPLQTNDASSGFATKENLDFEMFRVPISSRGFVNENGLSKIVLTAELPTEERYEISEVGLYSAGSNPSAGLTDSKLVFAFTQGEAWQYVTNASSSVIPTFTPALDGQADNNVINIENGVFQTNSDNLIFLKSSRANRYERCRFFNNIILIKGNESDITIDGDSGPNLDHFVIEEGSNYISLNGVSVDFSKNSPIDELRLAFSLVNKTGNSNAIPETVRILIDFSSANNNEFARFEAEINHGSSGNLENYIADFATNRYFVINKKLQELFTTANFSWSGVTTVKIYACVLAEDSGLTPVPSPDYYVALDALRLENVSTTNPLYGLTGYSIIKNDNAQTIVKSSNTNNYVEFRFSIGVT